MNYQKYNTNVSFNRTFQFNIVFPDILLVSRSNPMVGIYNEYENIFYVIAFSEYIGMNIGILKISYL